MATTRPYAPWYPGDILNDSKYICLSRSARLTYRELLDRAWINGAELPADPEKLAKLAGMTLEEFERDWAELTDPADPCFVPHPADRAKVINRRQHAEWRRLDAQAETARANGRKGGRPPKQAAEDAEEKTGSVISGSEAETQGETRANPGESYPDPESDPDPELGENPPTPLLRFSGQEAAPPEKKLTAKQRRYRRFLEAQAAYPQANDRHLASETFGRNAYGRDLKDHKKLGFESEEALHAHVLAKINQAARCDRWREQDGKYIPGLGKFLKERLWRGSFSRASPPQSEDDRRRGELG